MLQQNKNYPGFFITFEGGEGAGKTTLIESLARQLKSEGRSVLVTREPGGSSLGNQVRQWVLNRHDNFLISPLAELLLFLAARAQHLEERIVPALLAGHWVLCDRFNDSSIAYQGYARELGVEKVSRLCALAVGQWVPDRTFYLDVEPVTGLARSKRIAKENAAAGELDRIEAETLEFHEKVRRGFLDIAESDPGRVVVVNAGLSKTDVLAFVQRSLFSR